MLLSTTCKKKKKQLQGKANIWKMEAAWVCYAAISIFLLLHCCSYQKNFMNPSPVSWYSPSFARSLPLFFLPVDNYGQTIDVAPFSGEKKKAFPLASY